MMITLKEESLVRPGFAWLLLVPWFCWITWQRNYVLKFHAGYPSSNTRVFGRVETCWNHQLLLKIPQATVWRVPLGFATGVYCPHVRDESGRLRYESVAANLDDERRSDWTLIVWNAYQNQQPPAKSFLSIYLDFPRCTASLHGPLVICWDLL